MDTSTATAALAALAHPTRLICFRVLAEHEPGGVAAGEVARLVGVPQNTMSTHLAILARAGLAIGARQGRSIVYRANITGFHVLTDYLLSSCCCGEPELCVPGAMPAPATRKEPAA